MKPSYPCDECGELATILRFAQTYRIYIDGKDAGQFVALCDEHKPGENEFAPKECKRVQFYFPACVSKGFEKPSYLTPIVE